MVLGSTAAVLPSSILFSGNAAATCTHADTNMATTNIHGTELVVSFSNNAQVDGAREVVISNTSAKTTTLSQVYPGIVSTPEGLYDLNSLLRHGALTFHAHETATFKIGLANTHLESAAAPQHPSSATLSVHTTSHHANGGKPVVTTRGLYS